MYSDDEMRAAVIRSLDTWELRSNAMKTYREFVDAVHVAEWGAGDKPNSLQDASKRIFDTIDEQVFGKGRDSGFMKSIVKGSTFYRARVIEANQITMRSGKRDVLCGYGEGGSREPPLGVSSSGRANPQGSSYLYVANNEETACAEIKPHLRSFISVAQFSAEKDLTVVDYASEESFRREASREHKFSLGEFFTCLMFDFSRPVYDPADYLPTQIIADHLRKHGVDGVAYRSFLSSGGINYVFFNCCGENLAFEGRSRIFLYYGAHEVFWDLSDGRDVVASVNDTDGYSEEEAQDIIARLSRIVSRMLV